MTLYDGREFVLAAVGGEGVFHVAYVEAVVVFAEGFPVDGAITSPVSHAANFLDVFEDSYTIEFSDAGWTIRSARGKMGGTRRQLLGVCLRLVLPDG